MANINEKYEVLYKMLSEYLQSKGQKIRGINANLIGLKTGVSSMKFTPLVVNPENPIEFGPVYQKVTNKETGEESWQTLSYWNDHIPTQDDLAALGSKKLVDVRLKVGRSNETGAWGQPKADMLFFEDGSTLSFNGPKAEPGLRLVDGEYFVVRDNGNDE